jgi:hypothetical protein
MSNSTASTVLSCRTARVKALLTGPAHATETDGDGHGRRSRPRGGHARDADDNVHEYGFDVGDVPRLRAPVVLVAAAVAALLLVRRD